MVGDGGTGVYVLVGVTACLVFSAIASAVRKTSSLERVGSSEESEFLEQLTTEMENTRRIKSVIFGNRIGDPFPCK
jgi:hypothetical protein